MSWPMIHGGAAHPLFSVRLSLRMIAPIQGCLVDRHLIGSPIATLPLGRERRALRFETFHCLSDLGSGSGVCAGFSGGVEREVRPALVPELHGAADGPVC